MDDTKMYNLAEFPPSVRKTLNKAIAFQQNMYELSSDWNVYRTDEHRHLKDIIKYSCFGGGSEDDDDDAAKNQTQNEEELEKQRKIVDMLYGQIIKASRTRGIIRIGTIFNVLCHVEEKQTPMAAPVPVFKVQRCLGSSKKTEPNKKPSWHGRTTIAEFGRTGLYEYCVNYIDTEGRVYKNWTDYVTNNTLPASVMVLPMGGHYQVNPRAINTEDDTKVWLEICRSPAVGNVLPLADAASTVLGLGAGVIGLASLVTPIIAPVIIAGTACGAVTGLYTTARSIQQLTDRGEHEQSLSITDVAARSAWLGATGGLAGAAASGSAFALSKAVQLGFSVGKIGQAAYNGVVIGNVLINGLGIGNGAYGMYQNYQDNERISGLEVTQLVMHVLFFGNALVNIQTAESLINQTQQQTLRDFETSLRSNRHKKAFRRIVRNTQSTNNDVVSANGEIIRGFRAINNRDEFFAGCARNRKTLNAAGAEVTFRNGQAMINDNLPFNPMEFSQLSTDVRANFVKAAEPMTSNGASSIRNQIPDVQLPSELRNIIRIIRIGSASVMERLVSNQSLEVIVGLAKEMCDTSPDNRDQFIVKLFEIASKALEIDPTLVRATIDDFIWYLWRNIKDAANEKSKSIGINLDSVQDSVFVRELVDRLRKSMIDELLKSTEKLKRVIEEWNFLLGHPVHRTECQTCGGFFLEEINSESWVDRS